MDLSFVGTVRGLDDQDIAGQRNVLFRLSRSMEDTLDISQQETVVDRLNEVVSVMGGRERLEVEIGYVSMRGWYGGREVK